MTAVNGKQEAHLARLLAIFQVEAQEHVNAMSGGLSALDRAEPAQQAALIETVYREAHSLKGAARAVNLGEVEGLCQRLESVFAALRRGEVAIAPGLLDLLHRAVGALDVLLQGPEPAAGDVAAARTLGTALEAAAAGTLPAVPPRPEPEAALAAPAPPPPPAPATAAPEGPRRPPGGDERGAAETVRVSTGRLESLLLQAEELLSAKLTAAHRTAELQTLTGTLGAWRKQWTRVQPDLRALQHAARQDGAAPIGYARGRKQALQNLLAFLDWNETFVKALTLQLTVFAKETEHDQQTLAGMTDTLLEDMKQVLLQPFASLLEIFPRMVRDVARTCEREVALKIQGREIEIDRRILEALKDPLIHLVRNAVDHGIEPPEIRRQVGKPPQGTVTIAVTRKDGNKVEVRVADDGGGIDVERIRATAAKAGLLPAVGGAATDDAEALALIFHSGFSTSPIITTLSGRGLGLAIVREKIEKLGGTVTVESRPGAGTTFRLVLPLTLATCRGILVQTAGRPFVVPTTHIERVVSVHPPDIRTVGGRETIVLDGAAVALVRLADLLALPRPPDAAAGSALVPAVVLAAGERRIGLLVDAVLGEQEVLVKGLGPQLVRVRHIAGATVLGSGTVVPILHVADLLKTALQGRRLAGVVRAAEGAAPPQRPSILVAEDSITSRTLLKNILEAAGYEVRTAVDGVEALASLHSAACDLLVSDIEMPRLNGFDLTAQVRADTRLANLPVVLVTSLESRADRERGAEAGANAYLVKRGFDQDNLLDVIRRLI